MARSFTKEKRIAILISGTGTTAIAVAQAMKQGAIKDVSCELVIASKPEANREGVRRAFCLEKARAMLVSPRDYVSAREYENALLRALESHGIDAVALLGHIPLLPRRIIERYRGRAFNQHGGGLDPGRKLANGMRRDFGGRGMMGRATHAAMFFFGKEAMRHTGADTYMVEVSSHHLTAGIDDGDLIGFEQVAVRRDQSFDDFRARAMDAERRLQIRVLARYGRSGVFGSISRSMALIPDRFLPILARARAHAIAEYPKG